MCLALADQALQEVIGRRAVNRAVVGWFKGRDRMPFDVPSSLAKDSFTADLGSLLRFSR